MSIVLTGFEQKAINGGSNFRGQCVRAREEDSAYSKD